jgi:hypothetical protein
MELITRVFEKLFSSIVPLLNVKLIQVNGTNLWKTLAKSTTAELSRRINPVLLIIVVVLGFYLFRSLFE